MITKKPKNQPQNKTNKKPTKTFLLNNKVEVLKITFINNMINLWNALTNYCKSMSGFKNKVHIFRMGTCRLLKTIVQISFKLSFYNNLPRIWNIYQASVYICGNV